MHAFQGRTVDNVIAAMEANHPNLTTAKAFYVEISRARDRAELVTDDAEALKERLEAVTGERISALEGIGENIQREHGKDAKAALDKDRPEAGSTAPSSPDREIGRGVARTEGARARAAGSGQGDRNGYGTVEDGPAITGHGAPLSGGARSGTESGFR